MTEEPFSHFQNNGEIVSLLQVILIPNIGLKSSARNRFLHENIIQYVYMSTEHTQTLFYNLLKKLLLKQYAVIKSVNKVRKQILRETQRLNLRPLKTFTYVAFRNTLKQITLYVQV